MYKILPRWACTTSPLSLTPPPLTPLTSGGLKESLRFLTAVCLQANDRNAELETSLTKSWDEIAHVRYGAREATDALDMELASVLARASELDHELERVSASRTELEALTERLEVFL